MTGDELADMEATEQRGLENSLEILGSVIEEVRTAIVGWDADENVDRSESLDRRSECRLASLPGKCIRFECLALPSHRPDRLSRLRQFLASRTIRKKDGSSLASQRLGASESDSASSSSDQGNFAIEFHDRDCMQNRIGMKRVNRRNGGGILS